VHHTAPRSHSKDGSSSEAEEDDLIERPGAAPADGSSPTADGGSVLGAIWLRFLSHPLFHPAIAGLYVVLWTAYFLLVRQVTWGKAMLGQRFNYVVVVLCIEISKLSLSLWLCYVRRIPFLSEWRKGILYVVPATIYAVYNSMTFINLRAMDAASYQVILSSRIVMTALLFQRVFGRSLGLTRWVAVGLLCAGIALLELAGLQAKGASAGGGIGGGGGAAGVGAVVAFVLVLFQASLSASAGVYNEWLLKDSTLDMACQNAWMYLLSILINLGGLYYSGTSVSGVWRTATDPAVAPVIIVGALAGISTSVLLKYLDVIYKSFCGALEMSLTALIGWLAMGEPMSLSQVAAMAMVAAAVSIYNLPDETRARWGHQATRLWQSQLERLKGVATGGPAAHII
jgi:UDP-sugar transporter A1/2/3